MSRIEELEDILFDENGPEYLSRLADSGDADAMYVIGIAYYDGDCVKIDEDKAVSFLTAAANRGHIKATHDLGCFYYYGYGFSKGFINHPKARELLGSSAAYDYEPSMTFLASMLLNGEGGPRDVEAAKHLLTKAADMGSELAIQMLSNVGSA